MDGIDNLLNFYRMERRVLTGDPAGIHDPYPVTSAVCASGHSFCIRLFIETFTMDITLVFHHLSWFLWPQGRILRLGLKHPDLIDRLTSFILALTGSSNFEMETSAIYGFRGHCLAINVLAQLIVATV